MAVTPYTGRVPSRDVPDTFADDGNDFAAWFGGPFVPQFNAAIAALNLNSTTDASGSSVTIGTGAKTFAVSADKSFQPGMYLVIADAAAPSTNSMWGQVTSYAASTLVVQVLAVRGSGTKTAWVISQSAPGGAQPGANGDITSLTALAAVPTVVADAITAAIAAAALPAGLVMPWTGSLAGLPSGWIAVPTAATLLTRSAWSNLYTRIGTAWGAGDGSTTFGCPYCPPGYTFINSTNLGIASLGQVIGHTHRPVFGGTPSNSGSVYNNVGNTGLGAGASNLTSSVLTIESTGGAANLAAGMQVAWVLKV